MWDDRELPILRSLVKYFDDPGHTSVQPPQVATLSGLPQRDVNAALRALAGASPPYIVSTTLASFSYPSLISDVTERARRAVGQWPDEDPAVRLVAELRKVAEREPDERRRGKLRAAADAASEVGVKVLGEVLAKVITGGL